MTASFSAARPPSSSAGSPLHGAPKQPARKRICFLTRQSWPPRFGTEIATDRLVRHLPVDATVICRASTAAAAVDSYPYTTGFFQMPSLPGPVPLVVRRRLRQWLLHRRIAAVAPHETDIWHPQGLKEIEVALELARHRGGAVVATLHRTLPPNLTHPPSAGGPRRRGRAARSLLARCDAIVAVSRFVHQQLVDAGLGARAVQVYNGFDHPAELPPAPRGAPVLLFLGRLKENKGIDTLLQAWRSRRADLGDATLTFAGDGPLRQRVTQASAEPQSRITYLGWLGGAEKESALAAASIVVMPSIAVEAFPLTLLESLARGRPVLGTATGGAGELQRTGVNGWVVPPADPVALGEALVEAVGTARDSAAWQRLSAGARHTAAPFNWQRNANEIEAVYDAALARS